jgi:hypothetical protein
VCLRPYLVTEGRTDGEARQRLLQLIEGYIKDAVADGTAELFLKRRAPFRYYAQFVAGRLFYVLDHSFKTFSKTCWIPQHA